MEIRNTTKLPLKVPLPGGKKLFLGPGATGQVSAKAVLHPPVQELVDSGVLEVVDSGRSKNTGMSGPNKGISSSQTDNGGAAGMRQSGDR